MTSSLLEKYKNKKEKIEERLDEFKSVWKNLDRDIFSELCFCICTPQSKAVYCDRAVSSLTKSGVLFSGKYDQIRNGLKGVRFPNNKAKYIFEARCMFYKDGSLKIKDKLDISNILKCREWLVNNVKGLGYKEASHFLRNIGFGKDLAILDVHILNNMKKFSIINEIPKSITKKLYYSLENDLRVFATNKNIPMDALDLLFWSLETGEIFK
ncbi:MAG: N-glycosylase/DNA lyase [Candidatus Theseobacter exili]|nr:N-glycosylase/DNA lyase [Candidatus Theseobacter exili]